MAKETTTVSIEKNNPANTTFNLSVSTTGSTQKPKGREISSLKFVRVDISKEELIRLILKGHTLCHNFGHAVGEEFGISQKKKERFAFADMVMIDVDDSVVDMQTLVDSLSLTPSIAFTTYSNGVKGYRFRLVYLFNEHLGAEEYARAYTAIVERNGLSLSDNCMSSHTQCSFTNGSKDAEIITSDAVYSLFDLGIVGGGQIRHLETKNNNDTSSLSLTAVFDHLLKNSAILAEHQGKTRKEFMDACLASGKYPYIIHTPLNYNEDGFAILDDSYIEIHWKWYLDYREKTNGEKVIRPVQKKLRDGEGRHKKLWVASVLRRKIKPTITFDELLFNALYDLYFHYDNSDSKFSLQGMAMMCARVMCMPEEEVRGFDHWKDKRGYRINPEVYTTKEERQHARRAVKRIIKDGEIEKYYNPALTESENVKVMSENGIKVSERRLREYKKARGLKSLTKEEQIGNLYDDSLTDAQNIEMFESKGLSISIKTLRRWRKKNNYERGGQIRHLETKNNNDTSSLSLTAVFDHPEENVDERCKIDNSEIDHSIVDKAIKEVQGRCKAGYRKLYPTMQDYFQPLGDIIKDIPTIEDVMKARECFNSLIDTLQYNAFSDRFTITAYLRLFDNRIKAIKAA